MPTTDTVVINRPKAHRGGAPVLGINLYADAALRDCREVCAQVRAAGPVVWLPKHRMYAMGRCAAE